MEFAASAGTVELLILLHTLGALFWCSCGTMFNNLSGELKATPATVKFLTFDVIQSGPPSRRSTHFDYKIFDEMSITST